MRHVGNGQIFAHDQAVGRVGLSREAKLQRTKRRREGQEYDERKYFEMSVHGKTAGAVGKQTSENDCDTGLLYLAHVDVVKPCEFRSFFLRGGSSESLRGSRGNAGTAA